MPRFGSVCLGVVWGFAALILPAPTASAQTAPQASGDKKTDTFFAGTVAETSPEKLTVTRVVLGKKETRSFQVNADTKVQGKLRARVRVTVRYVSGENGDVATLVIVRASSPAKPK